MSIDDLSEFAIDFLLAERGSARQLVVKMAERMLQRSPLELIFVLSITASGIEETFGGEAIAGVALDTWRSAALLEVELHMMQRGGIQRDTCADLLTYWRTVDCYFLS